MIITLVGMPGCGKTTTGKKMAKQLGLEFIDADSYIEKRYKMSILAIFKAVGEAGFRKLEQIVLKEILQKENVLFATGGGMPCFFDNMELINKKSTSIYINLPAEIIAQRLAASKKTRPHTKGKSDAEILEYVKITLEKRGVFYQKAKFSINTADENIVEFIKKNNIK